MPEPKRSRRRQTDPALVEDPPVAGCVTAATWIGPNVLLAAVSGAPFADDGPDGRGRLITSSSELQVLTSAISSPSSSATDEVILVLRPAIDAQSLRCEGRLGLERNQEAFALEPADLANVVVELDAFASAHLNDLDGGAAMELLQKLISAVAQQPGAMSAAAPSLALLRERVRKHLPVAELHESAAYAVHVDGIWRIDRSAIYIEGWLFDRDRALRSLRLLSPEGRRVEIQGRIFRFGRSDVSNFFGLTARDRLGFIAFVELPEDSTAGRGWLLQAETADGTGVEFPIPPIADDPVAARQVVLGDLVHGAASDTTLLQNHLGPAIARLERRMSEAIEIDVVDQHGVPPTSPDVTIVVPLYRRTEFLEHQLAQFVHDPEICDSDLIYVLDSPEDAGHLRPFARHLFDLYRVPFRLATLTANGGFSVVNNLGASLATGRMLLMLNSDVLPATPGWLSRMVECYDAHPKVGVLAPKLLYEDDSIQHAGLYFDRPPGAPSWSNEHYYKGLHRQFPAANISRAVPAVTGACLLIGTDLYRSVGGLRGIYVRGDYEDSDLCLRLRADGLESWYQADVELYHLEGQSYPDREREVASYYNQLLHSDIWQDALTALGETP